MFPTTVYKMKLHSTELQRKSILLQVWRPHITEVNPSQVIAITQSEKGIKIYFFPPT